MKHNLVLTEKEVNEMARKYRAAVGPHRITIQEAMQEVCFAHGKKGTLVALTPVIQKRNAC